MSIRNKPLSQYDLMDFINKFKIKHFQGIYMRDGLPTKNTKRGCGIMNLDLESGNGTHWTCWYWDRRSPGSKAVWKDHDTCYYFDSFGLAPPTEFYKYAKGDVLHNTYKIQRLDDVICGHLCVLVLYLLNAGIPFHEISLFLYKNKR